jgi:hypothetical protein
VALPADERGRYQATAGPAQAYPEPPADPRHERFLPWRRVLPVAYDKEPREVEPEEGLTDRLASSELLPPYLIALALFFGLAYWRGPFVLARTAWRRRSWLLAPLPLLWLGLAVWLLPRVPFFKEVSAGDWEKVMVLYPVLGLAGLPVLSLLAWLGRTLRARRWRRVGAFLAALAVLTAASAVVGLFLDARRKETWEHYGWRDVPLLAAGWVLTLGGLLLLGRLFWWLVRPRRSRRPEGSR